MKPDQTIREAAHLMAGIDARALTITDNDGLVNDGRQTASSPRHSVQLRMMIDHASGVANVELTVSAETSASSVQKISCWAGQIRR